MNDERPEANDRNPADAVEDMVERVLTLGYGDDGRKRNLITPWRKAGVGEIGEPARQVIARPNTWPLSESTPTVAGRLSTVIREATGHEGSAVALPGTCSTSTGASAGPDEMNSRSQAVTAGGEGNGR